MKMIKVFLSAIMALGMITFASAQNPNVKNKEKHFEKIKSELQLSTDQATQISKIRQETQKKMELIRKDKNLSKEQKKSAKRDLKKSQKEQMRKILSDEQLKKMKAIHKREKTHRKGNKKNRKQLKTFRSEFDAQISSEDKLEIARLRQVMKDRKGVKDSSLTKEERMQKRKAFKDTHQSDFESLKALSDKYREPIKAFLKTKSEDASNPSLKEKGRRHHKKQHKVSRFLLMEFE